MKRNALKIIPAFQDDIGDLTTFRAMPTHELSMIDPFLFLNHHGHQVYPAKNNGLPFGPHPHRGFETVTFILEGDIAHKDSGGGEDVIRAGGVQWMTAGRGLIHSEISSSAFKKNGGPLEILQLWVNLPAKYKMTTPGYKGLQAQDIPRYTVNDTTVELVSGTWNGHTGPFKNLTNVTTMLLSLNEKASFSIDIPKEENVFLYVIHGEVEVNGMRAQHRSTVLLDNSGERIELNTGKETKILLCHALPYNEPVVSYGPFVMNTRQEIEEAIDDYQSGKLK